MGDEIEIRPGILSKDADGLMRCRPIFSKIMSLFAEQNDLQFAVPGGLIGACALAEHCFVRRPVRSARLPDHSTRPIPQPYPLTESLNVALFLAPSFNALTPLD